MGEVIRQLDTRREQVLVEAIIVEITDQLARELGVQFSLGGRDGSRVPVGATGVVTNCGDFEGIDGPAECEDPDEVHESDDH